MTALQPIMAAGAATAAAAAAAVAAKTAGKTAEQAKATAPQEAPQMKEMPNVSLGRDLVKQVEIIKAGDRVLEKAYVAETKPGKATFTLAEGNEVFPNLWDSAGGNYTPAKGNIILGYGNAEANWGIQNPNVLKEMEEKGLSVYPDKAVSTEPEVMYTTYVGADGRDFTKEPLKPGETVAAEKKIFPTKFLFAKPGTMVETKEARDGAQAMPKLGAFQYIQLDAVGDPYVKDIKDLTKRLNPTEDSKGIFDEVKALIKKRDDIKAMNLSKDETEACLAKVWEEALPKLMR